MAPKTERFEMRLDEDTIARVDEWRTEQGDVPSRAEAMRRLVERGLLRPEKVAAVTLTDGEKLLFVVLRDMCKQLGLKKGETNLDFVASAIYGGHYWAPKWEMNGLFHDHQDDEQDVRFVVNVLDMWSFIEEGYTKLAKKDRDQVAADVGPMGELVRFTGFDGNNEAELMSIASFLVNEMGRFSRFKGRDLNSHAPHAGAFRRMFEIFEPMRVSLVGTTLSASQIIRILQARAPRSATGGGI